MTETYITHTFTTIEVMKILNSFLIY